MSTYVIGDIQGCAESFFNLLDKVKFQPTKDRLWVAGDAVNRGPDNLSVLRYLKKHDESVVMVLGNHDLHLLATASGIREPTPKDTIHDVLEAMDCAPLLNWLKRRPLLHCEKSLVMTHAGVPHIWSIKQAKAYANEVEQVLSSSDNQTFFAAMYGDTPEKWDEKLSGTDRLRVITNYLTRMRLCKSDGTLDLNMKNGIENAPEGFAPWFKFPRSSGRKKRFLFGHWAALCGETGVQHAIALDTGCVWGGELTMLRLEDWQYFCTSCT